MPELKLTVAVDPDEVRTWAEKHSDAGHNSVATILFRFLDNPEKAAVDAEPNAMPASFYVDSRTAWKELPTGSVVSSADGLRTRTDTGWSVDGTYERIPEGLADPITIVSIPGEVE